VGNLSETEYARAGSHSFLRAVTDRLGSGAELPSAWRESSPFRFKRYVQAISVFLTRQEVEAI